MFCYIQINTACEIKRLQILTYCINLKQTKNNKCKQNSNKFEIIGLAQKK